MDDDPDFLAALAYGFRKRGFEVEEIQNYSDAVEATRTLVHGAVISDIDLGPGPNGVDLLAHLRQSHSYLPVILVTGALEPNVQAAALALDVTAILEKPVSVRQLAALIRAA